MSGSKIMYLGSFSFTKNNREGHGYNFAEFSESKDKGRIAIPKTLFGDKLDVSCLTPGDIVKCHFSEPEFLGAKPTLNAITVIEKSTIFKS